ncbi:unnamed protein product [Tilletia controversa]|nr:unnamed protein product [Tilletia controversa]CAD6955957.1 unnamed protein product [Tilletia controversa]CAD6964442.1 unnamed protein product [Tilletia controversa]CAD6967178.1 unnamed protein product [Tilletia controversa]
MRPSIVLLPLIVSGVVQAVGAETVPKSVVSPHDFLPTLPASASSTTATATAASTRTASTGQRATASPAQSGLSKSLNNSVPLQEIALPPLLSHPTRPNATNASDTYLLNTWSGRMQFHIGSLFENLVQASIPDRQKPSSKKEVTSAGATGCSCDCGCDQHNDDSQHDNSTSSSNSSSTPSALPKPSSTAAPSSVPTIVPVPPVTTPKPKPQQKSCFPALDFKMPSDVPDTGVDGWWCDMEDEYAFLGFSYDLSSCPSLKQLRTDFKRMRTEFNSRYVRLYSACESSPRPSMNDDLITAAWEAGLGLHMLIWFGFEGGNLWKTRKRDLLQTIKGNEKAPFVVRAVVVGSEPLFDSVLEPEELAEQIVDIKDKLSEYTGKGLGGMQVTLSEMPYGFMSHKNAPAVFKAMDIVEGNILPFFDQRATTGGQAWTLVTDAYRYFQQQAKGKKVLYTQIGWPSTDSVWKANSESAIASVKGERAFFNLLDDNCEWFKAGVKGGVGWFAHIWNDVGLPGWGIMDESGKLKFDFRPQTTC